MVLRPDEEANLAEVERDRRFRGLVKGAATTAVGVGASLGGSGIASKILPFINEYVPVDLAIKGISKISPQIGDMLKKGQQMGLDVGEGLSFLKDKMESTEQPKSQPEPDKRNIIEQYSPELHNFLEKEIAGGRPPLEAAALASIDSKDNKFKKIIDKMVKDHKTTWASIIQSVYGSGQKAQPPKQSAQQPQQQQSGGGEWDEFKQALMDVLNS